MIRLSHVIVLAALLSVVLGTNFTCTPCTRADLHPALYPCLGTALQEFVCCLFKFLKSLIANVSVVVALVICALRLLLTLCVAVKINVSLLVPIVDKCSNIGLGDLLISVTLKLLLLLLKPLIG